MQRDGVLIGEMIEDAEWAISILGDADADALEGDRLRRDSLLWNLTVLGEASNQVSNATKDRNPNVPWRPPSQLRNRIVHAYWEVDQLSLRGKTDDQLWFTLFHELGHVLLHGRDGLYLDSDDDDAECEADTFARDLLIPPQEAIRIPRRRSIVAVQEFADSIGIAPGVVLGRLHRETGDYSWGHQLKVRFEFAEDDRHESYGEGP